MATTSSDQSPDIDSISTQTKALIQLKDSVTQAIQIYEAQSGLRIRIGLIDKELIVSPYVTEIYPIPERPYGYSLRVDIWMAHITDVEFEKFFPGQRRFTKADEATYAHLDGDYESYAALADAISSYPELEISHDASQINGIQCPKQGVTVRIAYLTKFNYLF
jgi:hypothetical protein